MVSVIVTAAVGVASATLSSYFTYLFTKEKYNAEVDSALISNMKDALEFYKNLADDNSQRLEVLLERNTQLENEVRGLKHQLNKFIASYAEKENVKSGGA